MAGGAPRPRRKTSPPHGLGAGRPGRAGGRAPRVRHLPAPRGRGPPGPGPCPCAGDSTPAPGPPSAGQLGPGGELPEGAHELGEVAAHHLGDLLPLHKAEVDGLAQVGVLLEGLEGAGAGGPVRDVLGGVLEVELLRGGRGGEGWGGRAPGSRARAGAGRRVSGAPSWSPRGPLRSRTTPGTPRRLRGRGRAGPGVSPWCEPRPPPAPPPAGAPRGGGRDGWRARAAARTPSRPATAFYRPGARGTSPPSLAGRVAPRHAPPHLASPPATRRSSPATCPPL